MTPSQTLDQITGILYRSELPFEFHEEKTEIGISAAGTILFIRTAEWQGRTIVQIEADLAIGIKLTPEVKAGIYFWLSERNREARFGRFVIYQTESDGDDGYPLAWVSAHWELDGAQLEGPQLITALKALREMATEQAPLLTQAFGGQTVPQVHAELEELQGPSPDDEGSIWT